MVLFTFSLIACSDTDTIRKNSTDKTFEQTIDKKLSNIVNPKDIHLLASSNPYDYIKSKDGNMDYKYIISQGDKALNYMLKKFANSNANGLEEYIMALACSEILKYNPDSKNWSSGREWYNNYIKSN
jgi:hypothetical protein